MFEVGFTELLVIFVLALIVLGPEKLPRLAQQVGRWIGRARAMARQFREQLEEEVNLADVNKWQHSSPRRPADDAPGSPSQGAATPEANPEPQSSGHADPEPPSATAESIGGAGMPEHANGAHYSGPQPEPEAAAYQPPAYASGAGEAGAESSRTVRLQAVDTPSPHTNDTAVAEPDERAARAGEAVTTHERGI